MKFLGHIVCPTDGYTYIKDPKQVVIYFTPDSSTYMTEVICEKCGNVINGNIDGEFLLAFRGHGVKVLPFGQRFSALTEDMIAGWNMDKELRSLDDETRHRQY
jgi:hypothetical protein